MHLQVYIPESMMGKDSTGHEMSPGLPYYCLFACNDHNCLAHITSFPAVLYVKNLKDLRTTWSSFLETVTPLLVSFFFFWVSLYSFSELQPLVAGKAWQCENVEGSAPMTEDQEVGSEAGTYDHPSCRPNLLNVSQSLKIIPHIVKTWTWKGYLYLILKYVTTYFIILVSLGPQ